MHKTATWFFTMWVQNLATCYLDPMAMGGASTNSGKITWASLDKAAAFVGEKVSEVQLNDVDARRFHTKLGGFWDDGRNPKGGGERRFHPCRFQLRVSQQEPLLGNSAKRCSCFAAKKLETTERLTMFVGMIVFKRKL